LSAITCVDMVLMSGSNHMTSDTKHTFDQKKLALQS